MIPQNFAAELGRAVTAISLPFQPIEAEFLELGDQLDQSSQMIGDIGAAFGLLLAELEQQRLQELVRGLTQAGQKFNGIQTRIGQDVTIFEGLQETATAIIGRLQRLVSTAQAVTMLALNAKVAVAHIDAKDIDFTGFTSDITRLAQLASGNIEAFRSELSVLIGRIAGVLGDIKRHEKDRSGLVAAAGRRLQASLDSMAEQRKQAGFAVAQSGEKSRHMADSIGRAVGALQIGDITRQRIEHVRDALSLLHGQVTGDGRVAPWWQNLSDRKQELLVISVSRLQAAQLDDTAQEFDGESRRLIQSLQALAQDAQSMVSLCDGFSAADGRGSFLGMLGADLAHARELVGAMSQTLAGADKIAESVSQGVTGLTKHIATLRGIESDMRIMGLNTTFKCGRIGGQARALGVVAQELRVYANQTAEDTDLVMQGLDQLVTLAASLNDTARLQQTTDIQDLAGLMAGSATALDEIGESLEARFAAARRNCEDVAESLGASADRIQFHETLCQNLRQTGSILTGIGALGHYEAVELQSIRQQMQGLVEGNYTMASERSVQDLFADAASLRRPDPARERRKTVVQASPAALEDILF